MTRDERKWLREWVEQKRLAATDARKAATQVHDDDLRTDTNGPYEGSEWLRGLADAHEEDAQEIAEFIGWG